MVLVWVATVESNFSCISFKFFCVVARNYFSLSDDCRSSARNRSISISALSAAFFVFGDIMWLA